MTTLSIAELIKQKRIAFIDREGAEHMIAVAEYAANANQLQHFTERLNYLACRPDEVVVMFRDGRPEEHSFFWKQITLAEFTAGRNAQDADRYNQFGWPERQTYHGAMICRTNYDPVEWSVHT